MQRLRKDAEIPGVRGRTAMVACLSPKKEGALNGIAGRSDSWCNDRSYLVPSSLLMRKEAQGHSSIQHQNILFCSVGQVSRDRTKDRTKHASDRLATSKYQEKDSSKRHVSDWLQPGGNNAASPAFITPHDRPKLIGLQQPKLFPAHCSKVTTSQFMMRCEILLIFNPSLIYPNSIYQSCFASVAPLLE